MYLIDIENTSDSELRSRIGLIKTLQLQEGYTRVMAEKDAKLLGVCDYCLNDLAVNKGNCRYCTSILRGER